MEESFELRVKRLFGSQLFESVPRSSFPASSWSVVDGEVERREWNRERGFSPDRSEYPCSSAFAEDGCFTKKRSARKGSAEDFELDVDEIDVEHDVEDRGDREEDRREDVYGEENEIRSSIGLDPTLDNEEEEDEYDRAAVGGGDASAERLYMRDIKNHGAHLNYHSIFAAGEDDPYDGPRHFRKDPRADHLAAGLRIQEDQKSAENIPVPSYGRAEVPGEDIKLKPILKRKESQDDSKPKKRVRFDNANDDVKTDSAALNESPDVPDYVKNPSKYTRYSFDEYEDGDSANKGAFEDLRDLLHEKSNPVQLEPYELPKSIVFNRRRKPIDAVPVCARDAREGGLGAPRSTGIAASESFEADARKIDGGDPAESAMDTETPAGNERVASSRRGRRYRSVASTDV